MHTFWSFTIVIIFLLVFLLVAVSFLFFILYRKQEYYWQEVISVLSLRAATTLSQTCGKFEEYYLLSRKNIQNPQKPNKIIGIHLQSRLIIPLFKYRVEGYVKSCTDNVTLMWTFIYIYTYVFMYV